MSERQMNDMLIEDIELFREVLAENGTFETGQAILGEAKARIQDLEARLEAMTMQHEAALEAVGKAREAALREAAQCCDEVSKNYYEITQMKIGSEMCRADILALINKGDRSE